MCTHRVHPQTPPSPQLTQDIPRHAQLIHCCAHIITRAHTKSAHGPKVLHMLSSHTHTYRHRSKGVPSSQCRWAHPTSTQPHVHTQTPKYTTDPAFTHMAHTSAHPCTSRTHAWLTDPTAERGPQAGSHGPLCEFTNRHRPLWDDNVLSLLVPSSGDICHVGPRSCPV